MLRDQLTNEVVSKKFTNQFEMVNFAIKMATQKLKSGRACRVKTDVENQVYQVLEEIAAGKELLEDVQDATEDFKPLVQAKEAIVEIAEFPRKRGDAPRAKARAKLEEIVID